MEERVLKPEHGTVTGLLTEEVNSRLYRSVLPRKAML